MVTQSLTDIHTWKHKLTHTNSWVQRHTYSLVHKHSYIHLHTPTCLHASVGLLIDACNVCNRIDVHALTCEYTQTHIRGHAHLQRHAPEYPHAHAFLRTLTNSCTFTRSLTIACTQMQPYARACTHIYSPATYSSTKPHSHSHRHAHTHTCTLTPSPARECTDTDTLSHSTKLSSVWGSLWVFIRKTFRVLQHLIFSLFYSCSFSGCHWAKPCSKCLACIKQDLRCNDPHFTHEEPKAQRG